MISEFVQKTCTRRNLETVINTSFAEGICKNSLCHYPRTSTMAFMLDKKLDSAAAVRNFIDLTITNICGTVFFVRATSREFIRLTRDNNRVLNIWLCPFLVDDEKKKGQAADEPDNLSLKSVRFDHDDVQFLSQLDFDGDKKIYYKPRLTLTNVGLQQFAQIQQCSQKNSLNFSVGKTCDIDGYTQRNWSNMEHVVDTAYYCFIDTLLTALLENNIKMYMNMFKCSFLGIVPGLLINSPSGQQVLPLTLNSLIEDNMVLKMRTPLQCEILFNAALHVEGVSRAALGDAKRLAVEHFEACEADPADEHEACTVLPKKITTRFENPECTILSMEAYDDAYKLMKWEECHNIDEYSIGLMGENSQTKEAAQSLLTMIRESAPSPQKKKILNAAAEERERSIRKLTRLNLNKN